jgi:hypothetical protein
LKVIAFSIEGFSIGLCSLKGFAMFRNMFLNMFYSLMSAKQNRSVVSSIFRSVSALFAFSGLFCVAASVGVKTVSAQAVMPVIRNAPVDHIFIPDGFDDNDSVEVILHGHFDDSCQKVGPALGSVNEDTMSIVVAARALSYQGNECIPMRIPFVQSVKLGQLKAGIYNVSLRGTESGESKKLTVSPAQVTSADDYLYAPVDSVDLVSSGVDGKYKLTVKGSFPKVTDGCMVLDKVNAFMAPKPDVLVALPIARIEKDLSKCPTIPGAEGRVFETSQELELPIASDILIHVRVLNGQSLNKVYEIDD